ncbi:MAG: hypothetical protein ACTSRH_04420 [Promethearchaeota archaeon]
MKELEDLTDVEKAVLVVACKKLNGSTNCHQTRQRILKGVQNVRPRLKNKAFQSLVSNGFLREHPTKGSTTYNLTQKGLISAYKLLNDDAYEK